MHSPKFPPDVLTICKLGSHKTPSFFGCNQGPMILLIVGLSKSETLSALISCFLWMDGWLQGFSWDFTDPSSVLFHSMFSLYCSLGLCTSTDPEDYCDTDTVDLRLNPLLSQMFACGAIIVHIFVNTDKSWSCSANKIKIYISAIWQRGKNTNNKIKMHFLVS